MITVLTGDNGFALRADLDQITAGFVAEHGDLALERLDGETTDFRAIQSALQSPPFLAARKLVILRSPSASAKFVERVEKILMGLPETTDLVVVEPKPDKRTAYYKYLKNNTDFRELKALDASGLAQWLAGQAKAQAGSISVADARYLIERVGADQQLLAGELAKLILYQPTVTRATIDLLTEAVPQSTIFQLLEAAFGGRLQKAMDIYDEQRALKVEPQQIIAMLVWQLHVLALVKTAASRDSGAIAKQAKLNPYVVQKTQALARGISFAKLKRLIAQLQEIDWRLKRESLDADEVLKNYLLQISI